VDHADEVEEGGMVGFGRGGEDAEADGEEVGLRGEVVAALGGDDAFAEFAEGRKDGIEVAGAAGCGW